MLSSYGLTLCGLLLLTVEPLHTPFRPVSVNSPIPSNPSATGDESVARGFSQIEHQSLLLNGDWSSKVNGDVIEYEARGVGEHSVALTDTAGEVTKVVVRSGSAVIARNGFWHLRRDGALILPANDDGQSMFIRHCITYASLKTYDLGGGCWSGGVVDAASGCTVYTCGAGSTNCIVSWTYTAAEGGGSGSNTANCASNSHAYECATQFCWDFGTGP